MTSGSEDVSLCYGRHYACARSRPVMFLFITPPGQIIRPITSPIFNCGRGRRGGATAKRRGVGELALRRTSSPDRSPGGGRAGKVFGGGGFLRTSYSCGDLGEVLGSLRTSGRTRGGVKAFSVTRGSLRTSRERTRGERCRRSAR